jgi:hypothetical protein
MDQPINSNYRHEVEMEIIKRMLFGTGNQITNENTEIYR